MADVSTSLRDTAGGIDLGALLKTIHAGQVPYSEWAMRIRHGAELDVRRIDSTLRAADVGIMWPLGDMAREAIALNPKAQSLLGRAFMPIAAADYDLTQAEGDGINANDARRIAVHIRAMVDGIPDFRQALLDLCFGYFDGRAALEKQIEMRPSGPGRGAFVGGGGPGGSHEFWPRKLDWLIPQTLSYGPSRELIYVVRWGDFGQFIRRGPALCDVPGKYLEFTPRMFGDLQEREGLAPRYLFWLLFDRVGWRQREIVAERFGVPWLLIEQDIAKTLAGMKLGLPTRQDGGEAGAVAGDSKVLEYTETEAKNVQQDGIWIGLPGQKLIASWPPDSVREFFSQGSDQILDRLSYLTVHNGFGEDGQRATEVVKRVPEELLLDFRGSRVAEVIQRGLVNVLVELNYGADALPLAPKFQLRTQPPRDRDKEVDRILKVATAVPVAVGSLYEAAGIRAPNKGEDVVSAVALTPSGTEAITRVDEGRRKNGLPPVGGVDGERWIVEQNATYSAFGMAKGESIGAEGAAPLGAPAMPRDDGGGQDTTGALRDLVESADEDDQRAAAEDEVDGAARMARWFAAEGRKVQPRSANGTPETLVERGVREGARFTSSWADELADAADGSSEVKIYRALQRAAAGLDLEAFTRALERRLVHGAMLGGTDANYEMHNDVVIQPAHFDVRSSHGLPGTGRAVFVAPPLVVPGVPAASGIADFATMPFGEAIKSFVSKKILPRRSFDRLAAAAKRKAFTVAGLARRDMLTTAHDELTKAMQDGDDLRAFSKRLGERFDAAGWTRLNPSHVEVVFRNNVMGAYSSGRREQMNQPAVLAARPYRLLLGVDDSRTRVPHRQAHGKVLSANDAFLERAPVPWGHQCRCREVSQSAADLKRKGLTVTIGASLRGLPDEGWDSGASSL